jgi:hypothetical protein
MVQETLDHVEFVNDRITDVEGFWLATMVSTVIQHIFSCRSGIADANGQLQHANLKTYISSKSDRDALQYLTKIELVQDVKDPRPFSLKFVSHYSPSIMKHRWGTNGPSTLKRTLSSPMRFSRRCMSYRKELSPHQRMAVLPKTCVTLTTTQRGPWNPR